MIETGAAAPDFTLPDTEGNDVSLGDFDSKLVLVFYPAAFSGVCNDQLSIYSEVVDEIRAQGAELVAISVDNPFSLKAFRDSIGSTIPMLADFHPKGDVAKAYGAYIEERGHTNRSLVLVDEQGTIAWTYESPPLEVPGANLIFDALAAAN